MRRAFTVSVCLVALTFSALAQAPSNDLCANAIPVFDGVNPGAPSGASGSFFTNAGAGTELTASCAVVPNSVNDVWFTYTATGTGTAVFRFCTPAGYQYGTLGEPSISVYSSCGGPELACALTTTYCGASAPGIYVAAGATYLVRVASQVLGPVVSTGTFYLTVLPPVPAPPNDWCASATQVFGGVNPGAPAGASGNRFTNAGAGNEGTASCDNAAALSGNDVWFSYTAPASGVVTVRNCTPAGFAAGWGDMVVSVWSSCGGPELVCRSTGMNAAASCSIGGPAPPAFMAAAGSTYIIRVGTHGGLFASFYLTIVPPPPAPPNDACVNALPVSAGSNGPYTNAGATPDGTASCTASLPQLTQDVWFTYTPAASGVTTIQTVPPAGLSASAQIAVFAACGGPELACSAFNAVSVSVTAGATYVIRVDSPAFSFGGAISFQLAVSPPSPAPPNDECTGAIPLAFGANGPFANPTATPSAGGAYQGLGTVDVWYSFTTGACPGAYTVEACPQLSWQFVNPGFEFLPACGGLSLPYPLYNPYTPPGCPNALNWVRATIQAGAFTTYLLRVHTSPGSSIPYNLSLTTPTTGAELLVTFSSPFGPSSVQAKIGGLPPNGFYFLPVTLAYLFPPSGSFYGLNMTNAELLAQFNTGFPFTGSADACGNAQIGPFFGVPTGTIITTVVLGFASGWVLPPTSVTWPATYTVP